MKNKIWIIVLFLMMLSITGCQNNQNNNSAKQENLNKEGFRRPDFGQPEERANMSGLVKDIIGNEVTILKIERPNRNTENGEDPQKKEQEANSDPSKSTGQANITRTFSGTGGTGLRGGMGMRSGTRPEMSDENRSAMLERIKSISSGEDKVLIPVGIRMLKFSNGEPVEATLEDVKQDKMLMIWLDESVADRNIAKFVVIN